MDKFSTYFMLILVCILLIWIYDKFRNNIERKIHTRSQQPISKTFLGFEDLPKVKSWIPLKLIGNLPQLFPLTESTNRLLQWSQEYGDVFTAIGLNNKFVVLNSGPAIEALMKSGDFGHIIKPPVIYGPMRPFVTNGILVSKGDFWQKQRKIYMKTQSFPSLKTYVPMIETHSQQLVRNLEKLFEDGEAHEIIEYISATFLGITNEMITGKSLVNFNELREYHRNFSIWKEVMSRRTVNPLLLFKPIWMFHPLYQPYENALKGLFNFSTQRLKEHKEEARNECNHKFKSLIHELADAGMKDEQIVDEINTMMFGGHGSGSCTIHFLCFCMALNPQFQLRARHEIDDFFENQNKLKERRMTYELVQTSLKYLEQCILETMRLYPPAFALARHLETSLMIEYNKKPVLIPEGVNIFVCPISLHRREDIYPEPDVFDPDRFTPEECAKRHAYTYLPFSAGPRNCLGQKLAMIELKIIAAHIFRHFEVETTDKLEDLQLLPYITIAPAKDFVFRFKKRSIVFSTS